MRSPMRSAILIFLTVVALVGAFVAYTMLQPQRAHRATGPNVSAPSVPAPPPATAPANQSMPVTSGDDVFVERYDNETGQLASRFRASRYDPQPDGTVHVEHPEAEFFLNSRDRDASGQPVRQVLRLRGEKGDIVVPPTPGGSQAMNRPQMPSRGKLYNVNVSLFNSTTAKRPTLVCRVNNLAFDNDTFRIATDSFTDAQGRTIDADRVPVYMTGDDYDFEGRGLTIMWDEKERHLQLLEVARGQMLTVKKPGAFGTPKLETNEPRANKKPEPAGTRPARARRARDESAPSSPKPQPTTTPSTKPAREAVPYRATFNDNVVITQGDQQLAVADVMNVDLLNDNREDDKPGATTAPAAQPTDSEPATRPVKKRPATANAVAAAAATQPAEPVPVVVKWTGKLRVVPIPPEMTAPVSGDSVVELMSDNKPVLLNWQGSDVVCASARYHSLDDSASIRSSAAVPLITMRDQRGTAITTPSFDYDGGSHLAVLRGVSHADLPLESGENPTTRPTTQPVQFASVDWTDRCTMRLAGRSRESMTIEQALIEGDVKIDSPQLAMRSDKLDLTFDPKKQDASTVAVRELAADGNVRAVIRDSHVEGAEAPTTQPQKLDCAKLNVHFDETPDGRSYPKRLVADGSVRASNDESTLTAGHLDATLAPATQPAVADVHAKGSPTSMPAMQLESMVAIQDVRATGTDGQFAQAEQLKLERGADGPKYTLVGQQEPARVGDARSVMSGPIIEFEPDAGRAHVLGAGTLHAVQIASKENPTTRPVNVTWTSRLDADTNAKHAELNGDVVATSMQEDGTTTVARGQKMLMELSDPPPAKPSATTSSATTRPRARGGFGIAMAGGTSGMAVGDIRTVTLQGPPDVEVNSTLVGADGTIQRRINLFAPTLTYNLPDKRLTVPVAGRMLYQDERPPPATRPADAAPTAPPTGTTAPLGDTRGATAFEWQKSFTYDSADHRATMNGNVVVVHQSPGNSAPAYRLNADRVIADMQPPPASPAATQPNQKPAATDDPFASAKLKKLTADGGVTFNSARLQFNSDSIEFDPETGQLVARGTDRVPATLFDENGLSKGTFSEMYYDTKTDRMRLVNPRAAVRK
jgi:lipopolysaccharide export system protein LptA